MSVRNVAYENDNSACLHLLIMSPYPYFIVFPAFISVIILNNLMIFCRIIQYFNPECSIQN